MREFNESCIVRGFWRNMSIYLIASHHGELQENALVRIKEVAITGKERPWHVGCLVRFFLDLLKYIVAGPYSLMTMAHNPWER